jgi:hypothetical protein
MENFIYNTAQVAKIGTYLGAVIVSIGGKLGKDPSVELIDYIKLLQDTKHITTYTNILKDGTSGQLAVLKAPAETSKEAAEKFADDLYNTFSKISYARILTKVLDAAKHDGRFDAPETGLYVPYAIIGKTVHAFSFNEDEHFKSITFTAKPDALSAIKVDMPTKAGLIKLLGMVAETAKKSKEFESAVSKEINDADKLIADLSKEVMKGELTPEAKRSVTNYSNTIRIVTANLAVDSILAQVRGTKAILAYCTMGVKNLIRG